MCVDCGIPQGSNTSLTDRVTASSEGHIQFSQPLLISVVSSVLYNQNFGSKDRRAVLILIT